MLTRLTLLMLLFCFSITIANGQKKKKKNEVQIIEFDDENKIQREEERGRIFLIKTSPLSYISGKQFVEVEKEITDYFSLQAGVGLTFKSLYNVSDQLLSELNDNDESCSSEQWGDNDYCDDIFDFNIRTFKPGIYLSISPRLYFDDFAPEDSYFGLKLRYSTLNMEVQKIEEGLNNGQVVRLKDDLQSESVKRFDIVGHYGYQTLYKKLSASYFVGLGIRFEDHTRQDLGYDDTGRLLNGEQGFNKVRLRVEGGVRIGFQL